MHVLLLFYNLFYKSFLIKKFKILIKIFNFVK